jgi:hypothetical protein
MHDVNLRMQAKGAPAKATSTESRSDHVKRWRDCPPAFGRTPERDLPHEVRASEAEWRRLEESTWQVLLPSIDGDTQVDAIYNDCHWSHQLLVRWLHYREPGGHRFRTDPAQSLNRHAVAIDGDAGMAPK